MNKQQKTMKTSTNKHEAEQFTFGFDSIPPSLNALLESMTVAKVSLSEMNERWRQLNTSNRPLRPISYPHYDRTRALLAEIDSAVGMLCSEPLDLDEVTLKAICGIQEYANYARIKVDAQLFSDAASE